MPPFGSCQGSCPTEVDVDEVWGADGDSGAFRLTQTLAQKNVDAESTNVLLLNPNQSSILKFNQIPGAPRLVHGNGTYFYLIVIYMVAGYSGGGWGATVTLANPS